MQKIQLAIPEPCHENWQHMTPTDQGRYCNACAKVVVDFSMMSDAELLNYFSTLKDEKVCGRALPSQLDRAIAMPREPKKRLFWHWNYIMMVFMLFSKSGQVKAQTKGKVVAVPIQKPTCNVMMGTMAAGVQVKQVARVITGKVTDIDGKPVPFATVKIKGTVIGVSADANGVYSIKAHTGDVLEYSSAGFEKEHKLIDNNSSVIDMQLQIPPILNGVVVTDLGIKREARELGGFEVTVLDSAKTKKAKADDVDKRLAEKVSSSRVNLFNKDSATHNTTVTVRLGGVRSTRGNNQALLVVDDVLQPISYIATLNPNDVEHINVLKGASASALYGSDAANGVIIITTKHKKANETAKVKKDSIARSIVNTVTDSVRLLIKPNTIKVYPNPVQRGNACFVSLSLKQPGDLQMQVTDVNGRVVLKKQVAAGAKDILDKIETGSNWATGIYFISIYDMGEKLISKVSFSVL